MNNTRIIKTSNTYSDYLGYNDTQIDAVLFIVSNNINANPATHVKDVNISNLTIQGNSPLLNKYGIYVHNLSMSKIENVYVENCKEGIFSFAFVPPFFI